MVERLHNGNAFPAVELPRVGGGTLALPGDLAGRYAVVLIYRGHWCPFCNDQIAAFADASETLSQAGIDIVAFSVDDEAATAAFAAAHHVRFAMGHSANVDEIVTATGAYETTHPPRGRFIESTGFVLAPDGAILAAVYASRAIGRLVPGDVIRLVTFMRSQAK